MMMRRRKDALMTRHKIAVIPGDGIGQEITPAAVEVLQQLNVAAEYTFFPWGSDYYREHGVMMPDDGLDTLKGFDAIYFGAVGSRDVPDHITLRGLRLKICQGFDQYANVRPATLLPGIPSPLHGKQPADIDLVVVRENTEGEYTGAGGYAHASHAHQVAVQTAVFTRTGTERVIRYAFELARSRPRKHLVLVTKSNAQEYSLGMWDDVFNAVHADFPDVETERMLVDAAAARMVLHPESLDVLVASNLFGDILTDIGGAIIGSLGMAPSGNINPERDYPSMFEPIHGSAFDIVGQHIANPIGMLLSGELMLDYLGEQAAAERLRAAVIRVTRAGNTLTPDVGGAATTSAVCEAVVNALQAG